MWSASGSRCCSAPDGACGDMTSGGSESIFLAVLACRNQARAEGRRTDERERRAGALRASRPSTRRPACWGCAACACPSPPTFAPTSTAMARVVDADTLMLVGSAPCFPYGLIDPIAELCALARSVARGSTSTPASVATSRRSRVMNGVRAARLRLRGSRSAQHLRRPPQVRLCGQRRLDALPPQRGAARAPGVPLRRLAGRRHAHADGGRHAARRRDRERLGGAAATSASRATARRSRQVVRYARPSSPPASTRSRACRSGASRSSACSPMARTSSTRSRSGSGSSSAAGSPAWSPSRAAST